MRVVSGSLGGLRFPEKNMPHARPTTDRAKEALFNILTQRYHLDTVNVLDLYSGLGSMAFEFYSRGAVSVTAVDYHRKSVQYIRDMNTKWNAHVEIKPYKVLDYLKRNNDTFDIIFADPPYNAGIEIQSLLKTMQELNPLKSGGTFILEHETQNTIHSPYITETRNYGQSTFSFFNFEKS